MSVYMFLFRLFFLLAIVRAGLYLTQIAAWLYVDLRVRKVVMRLLINSASADVYNHACTRFLGFCFSFKEECFDERYEI